MSEIPSFCSGVLPASVQIDTSGGILSGQITLLNHGARLITSFHPDEPQAAPAWAVADWLEEHGWDVLARVVRNGEMTR